MRASPRQQQTIKGVLPGSWLGLGERVRIWVIPAKEVEGVRSASR
jgi:hypothetical protein